MAISEIVDVSITEVQAGTSLNAFYLLCIVAAAADTTPTSYSSIASKRYTLDVDGVEAVGEDWGTSSEAYKAAVKANSQEPKPSAIYITKRGTAVASEQTITFSAAVASGQTIAGTVNGTAISVAYDTSAAATYALLETAIEAIEGVASVAVAGDVLTVTSTAEWTVSMSFAVTGGSPPTTTVATTVAGRTIADDIGDALAEDETNLWYGIITCDTNKGLQLTAAATIEATEKMYFLRTSEAASATAGGTDSLASKLNALNYRRTLGYYHHDLTEYIDIASMSYYLAYAPGAIMLANKSVTGVTASPTSSIDATAVSVVQGRKFNTYRKFGAFSMIRNGVRVDGNVIEATRDLDYARNELRADFLVYLSQTLKPSYDEQGLADIKSIGEAVARRLVSEGILRGDTDVEFFVPKLEDISSSDQAAQTVSNCYLLGTLKKGVLTIQINLQITI